MGSRHQSEKERKRAEQEKLQMILNKILKEEENKYCADCEAKGPRWASWNLGVFLCIRCAGIHRNLGVHLSKVKSVNLDTWTAEQVQHMRVIGNSVGKAVYEASLPDHFRRPQTDSALEAFIRGKYEHKRYLMKDYVPAKIDARDLLNSDEFLRPNGAGGGTAAADGATGAGKGTAKKAGATTITLETKAGQVQSKRDSGGTTGKDRVRRRSSNAQQNSKPDLGKSSTTAANDAHGGSVASALNDLVDLDLGGGGSGGGGSTNWVAASAPNLLTANSAGGGGGLDDLLGLNAPPASQQEILSSTSGGGGGGQQLPPSASNNGLSELGHDLFFGSGGGSAADGSTESAEGGKGAVAGATKKTKNDILALYGGGGGGPQAQTPVMGAGGGILMGGGGGFNAALASQMPFVGGAGIQGQQQMMNFAAMPTSASSNNWAMNEPYGHYQQHQHQPPPPLCDPHQQPAAGYVATPFGYVPVAQTSQHHPSFNSQATHQNVPPTNNNHASSNLHLQAVQQQLASLQLQRAQSQHHHNPVTSPQQDTLATSLWH